MKARRDSALEAWAWMEALSVRFEIVAMTPYRAAARCETGSLQALLTLFTGHIPTLFGRDLVPVHIQGLTTLHATGPAPSPPL